MSFWKMKNHSFYDAFLVISNRTPRKILHNPENRGSGDGLCIMVAHAVYIKVNLLAEGAARGAAAAGHGARRTAACAAGSIGRPAAVVVAEAAHGGVVIAVARSTMAAARRGMVVVVAVATGVPIVVVVAVVAPVPVTVVISVVAISVVVISVVIIAMARGRVGLVVVVSTVEAAAPMAVATLEGHEHCGTVEEHSSGTVAGVDGEGRTGVGPDDRTVEPLAGQEAVILPGAEHIAQVAVADVPPEAKHVGPAIEVEQVVEINLIHCLILCCYESELVGHLVTEEEGLVACCGVRHCCGGDGYRHHHHHGQDLLHCLIVLMVELLVSYLLFSTAKVV